MSPPCVGLDPNEFFPAPAVTPHAALACCRRCDHVVACARAALDTPMVCGVWAGIHIHQNPPRRRDDFAALRALAGERNHR